MSPVRRAAVLCAFALAGGVAHAADEPTQTVAQGVTHDALFAMSFDGSNGVAAGAPGRVLSTSDGGKTWTAEANFPTALAVLGADVVGDRALVVGQMGLIALREGRGAWKKLESGTTERLMNVDLNKKGLAVAVGSFGAIVKSSDGGATWQAVTIDWQPFLTEDQIAQGIQPHLYAVHVDEDGTIVAAGELGLIVRSTDGGASWKAQSNAAKAGTDATVFALDLRDDGTGYAVGQDGLMLKSRDAGVTWARLPSVSKANLLGVRSAGDKAVISAMHDMLTSADGGKTWERVSSQDVRSGWYSGVGVSGGTFLAVGHTGRIIRLNL